MDRNETVAVWIVLLIAAPSVVGLTVGAPGVGAAPPAVASPGVEATVLDAAAAPVVDGAVLEVTSELHPPAAPWQVNGPPASVVRPVPVLLLAYSRYDGSDPLTHENRRSLFEAVTAAPGRSLAQHADDLGVPVSTVRYHARVLVEEGLARTALLHGRRRLFPATGDGDDDLAAALADDATRPVLRAVVERGPASVSTLADAVDRAPSTVSHHLDRLEADGLVDRDRLDGAAAVTAAPAVARALARGGR